MSCERSCWDIYQKEMLQLNRGHALWEPGPHSYKRIQPGDVGYIREGCFHLLFSAGCPLGGRVLGVDVPLDFKELEVGRIFNREAREPGCLTTKNVRAIRARPTPRTLPSPASTVPMLESGRTISFRLSGGQAAALVTRYQIRREDIERAGTPEKYIKEHYASWVEFASVTGHGDINPILVTGVDRTGDFAMMSYDDDDGDLRSEFTTSVPGDPSASAWGTWYITGFIHTNCGPQLRFSPSSIQTMVSVASGSNDTGHVSDEYDQCVFVRYYTMRKRLGIPKIIKAGAGPHDPGSGDRKDGGSPAVEAQSPSNSSSDILSSFCDDDGDNDRSSVTSIESEPETIIHTTTADEKDDFDAIADYVLRNSDADSVLIHHQDIALLRELEDSTDLSAQLLEKRPPIIVDENGVGAIGGLTNCSVDVRSNGIIPPTPAFIPSEIEHEATNRTSLPEPRPPSPPECPLPGSTQEVTSDADTIVLESNAHVNFTFDRLHIEDQSLNLTSGHHNFHREVTQFSEPGAGDERKRIMTPDEGRKMRRALSGGSQGSESRGEAQVPPLTPYQTPDHRRVEKHESRSNNAQEVREPLPPIEEVTTSTDRSHIEEPLSTPTTAFPPSHWHRIPQTSDHERQRRSFKQLESIHFSVNGRPGVNVEDALRRRFTYLDGGNDPVLLDAGPAISCRLSIPGYPSARSHRILTRSRDEGRLITRSQLANEVARKLERYFTSMISRPVDGSTSECWKIGEGFMHLHKMFLVRLDPIARGSWRPEIWVDPDRHRTSSPEWTGLPPLFESPSAPAAQLAWIDGFTPQDYHPSRSEQSIVPRSPEASAYDQDAPFYFPNTQGLDYYEHCFVPTPEGLEPSVSNEAVYPSPSDLGVHCHPQAPADFFIGRRAMSLRLASHTNLFTSHYEKQEYFSSPLEKYSVEDPLDPNVTSGPHSMAMGYPLPFITDRSTPVAYRGPSARRHTDASVSGLADRAGSEGTTDLPAGPPLVNDAGSQAPKKRKPVTTPDEAREVKRTRRRRSQSLVPREQIQTTSPIRSHLRRVEQVQYQSKSVQKGQTPLPSIYFNANGVEGINLTDAMDLRFDGLDGRDDPMFVDRSVGRAISCRIRFMDCPACSKPRQIVTTNHRKERSPITRQKLAYEVAKSIKVYLEELEKDGTPFHSRFEDMYLKKLVNVSRASFQPEIWC